MKFILIVSQQLDEKIKNLQAHRARTKVPKYIMTGMSEGLKMGGVVMRAGRIILPLV